MTELMRDEHKVDIPEGEVDGLRTVKFTVPERGSLEALRLAFDGRGVSPGDYTKLEDTSSGRSVLWMSDTDAEWRDHAEAVYQIRRPHVQRVLINGLGIGMVLKAALACDHVRHVDVVEIDERCIKLVGPAYDDPRVTIHHANAYEQARRWPVGTRWEVAWRDIWPTMTEDNLPLMAKLHRSYGRRVDWQGSWGKVNLEYDRRRTADAWWR